MKITLELPKDLLIAAEKKAAESRLSLCEFVEQALRREVQATESSRHRNRARRIRWVTAKGGLPPGFDVADREQMHAWLGQRRPQSGHRSRRSSDQ